MDWGSVDCPSEEVPEGDFISYRSSRLFRYVYTYNANKFYLKESVKLHILKGIMSLLSEVKYL